MVMLNSNGSLQFPLKASPDVDYIGSKVGTEDGLPTGVSSSSRLLMCETMFVAMSALPPKAQPIAKRTTAATAQAVGTTTEAAAVCAAWS